MILDERNGTYGFDNTSMVIGGGASGISFSGLQRLPTMDAANYVVWVSGTNGPYQAMRTADGIVEFSGGSGFAATVIQNALDATQSGGGGQVIIKDGTYPLLFSGLRFTYSATEFMDLGGVGHATFITYTSGRSGSYA